MTDTNKPRKELKRMSDKRLAQLGGKAFSTLQPKRDTTQPSRSSSRSSGTKTGMPIRHSTPKRKPRSACETTRIYGSREFRDWFHTLPCVGCGISGYTQMEWRTMGYVAPMEKGCHQAQHDMGAKSFAALRGIDYEREITRVAEQWRAQGGDSR